MLVYLLGFLDLIATFIIMSHVFLGWFSIGTVLYNVLYIIIKGLIFAKWDFASKIDLFVGAYILLLVYGIYANGVMTIIVFLWLLQKSLFSLSRPLLGVMT